VKRPAAAEAVLSPALVLLAQCGGGLPLLHPAHTLAGGDVRAATGFTGNIATGDFSAAVRDVTSPSSSPPPAADDSHARAALALASVAPGVAPMVGARVGLGHEMEGGLAYTARAVRADARRSFDLSRQWSLSVGAGGTAVIRGYQAADALRDLELGALHGWGADLPVLVGFASDGDLYQVWLGARGGWEHVDLGQPSASGASSESVGVASLSATRLWAGGLLGVAVGFRHVHVSMEMDACYATVAGEYGSTHARVSGLTLAPASSIWWGF
jgi:hypothetical protein